MKHDIFNEWLSKLNHEFHFQSWYVVLIIDNALSYKFVTSIDKNDEIDNDYDNDYKDNLTNDKSEESLDNNETNNTSK